MGELNSELICKATGASAIVGSEKLQSLWSGCGEIVRVFLNDGLFDSIIVKHIKLPEQIAHPRGWNSKRAHQRKWRSYQVECHWYQHYAKHCPEQSPLPECLGVLQNEHEIYLLLSDLRLAGFSEVKNKLTVDELRACLNWLASFHANFMQQSAPELWPIGCYWHLETRPDELAALADTQLKNAAAAIDKKLSSARFQTLVHGDAKLANFCFSGAAQTNSQTRVAAVDFQYVGRGCGIKDVAYFLGSCLNEQECEELAEALLDDYFLALNRALESSQPTLDRQALNREWRALYAYAWADFQRFLLGWSPGHWKINTYSQTLTKQVLQQLGKYH
ncbi:phosphotransferase [Agaribacterium haliotis]|uniref:phosphotransferase n=1 Tax=Agaribacterium haliotis TaxID=2013869 RepID=UPI000BB53536|nr:phosphotransferase [Agaribacterium haliotis]